MLLTSVSAYQIPADATIAYILVYKQGGTVNLGEVQIEFGNHITSYEPYNPIAGYISSNDGDLSYELQFPPVKEGIHGTYTQIDAASIYDVFDNAVSVFPSYITKTALGKDASDTYNISGYTIAFTSTPLYKILFVCNQHGGSQNGDQPMGAYIATKLLEDLCGAEHRYNPLLRWVRENVQISIIPIANPWGLDHHSRTNYNGVDLNRNWPTSGWSSSTATDKGASAADQPEVQHCLSFISSVQPNAIIDNHTLGGTDGTHDNNSGYMYVGFPKDKENDTTTDYSSYFSRVNALMQTEFGITVNYLSYAGNTDTTPDLRVWCYENGYNGGLIEMQWRDPLDNDLGFTASIINASYMLGATLFQYYSQVY